MAHELYERLTPVRDRLHRRVILETLGPGLLIGSSAAVLLALTRVALPSALAMALAAMAIVLGPTLGALLGRRRRPRWRTVAAHLDRCYRLQDRTVTALEFLEQSQQKPMMAMQIDDATSRLATIDAKTAVPLAVPRNVIGGALLLPVAILLILWPIERSVSIDVPAPEQVEAGTEASAAALVDLDHDQPPLDVDWQVAPAGRVTVYQADITTGPPLEQLVSEAQRHGTDGTRPVTDTPQPSAGKQVVLEDEPLPPQHRPTIRRYFQRTQRPDAAALQQ